MDEKKKARKKSLMDKALEARKKYEEKLEKKIGGNEARRVFASGNYKKLRDIDAYKKNAEDFADLGKIQRDIIGLGEKWKKDPFFQKLSEIAKKKAKRHEEHQFKNESKRRRKLEK